MEASTLGSPYMDIDHLERLRGGLVMQYVGVRVKIEVGVSKH